MGRKEVRHTQNVSELALKTAVQADASASNLFSFSSITGDVNTCQQQFNR